MTKTVETICGAHAQLASSVALSLAARVPGLKQQPSGGGNQLGVGRPPQTRRCTRIAVLRTAGSRELAEVEVGGSTRWVLASDIRALRSAPRAEGVRLLPSFDQLLVVSAPHPEAVVDPEHAGRVYRPRIAVWSLPAVLVDGRVRAGWKLSRQRDRVIG